MSTAIAIPLEELHEPKSGRYDARRLAEFMGVSMLELARAVGANPDALRRRPTSQTYQAKLGRIAVLLRRVLPGLKDPRRIRTWLRAASPDLDDASPLQFLLDGRLDVLEDWIRAARTGQGA